MPSTTNYSLPYPAATDAPDGPGAFYNLALAVDTIIKSKFDALQKGLNGTVQGTTPGIVANLFTGKGQTIEVNLQATNYYYRYFLWVSHSPFNNSIGQVYVINVHTIDNTANLGPVTQWTITSSNLYATIGGAGSTNIAVNSTVTKTS